MEYKPRTKKKIEQLEEAEFLRSEREKNLEQLKYTAPQIDCFVAIKTGKVVSRVIFKNNVPVEFRYRFSTNLKRTLTAIPLTGPQWIKFNPEKYKTIDIDWAEQGKYTLPIDSIINVTFTFDYKSIYAGEVFFNGMSGQIKKTYELNFKTGISKQLQ